MQAANEGASSVAGDGSQRSVGIRVDLPFEQEINSFVGQAYEHRTFFSRLHHFMIVSDAFVVVPGGIGSLELDSGPRVCAMEVTMVKKNEYEHDQ